MIGSLFYLTVMRPDIQFSVWLCARFQASPRISHRQAVKRIFRYLGHTPDLAFGTPCRCLNLSTSIGGTCSKVEGGDRHDLELEGMRKNTGHKIYTGSGCQGGEPHVLFGDQVWRPALGVGRYQVPG
jgi:hypothetical protein